jgi:two-component system, cell cycle response regulator
VNRAFDDREVASLSERMGYLQSLRVGFAVVVLSSAAFAPRVVGGLTADLLIICAGYLALAAGLEVIRSWGRGRKIYLIGTMLLVDGAFLAWIMYVTGGTQSPLRYLLYIHLIAVTLLASYRTGLKIALWHSLLFFLLFYAQAADLLKPTDAALGLIPGSPDFNRISLFNISAFWLVALATAAFSSLNERELRRRKADLEDLSAMSAALKQESEPGSVAYALLDAVSESFGSKRGFVAIRSDDRYVVVASRGPEDAEGSDVTEDAIVVKATTTSQTLLVAKPDTETDREICRILPFARNLIVVPLETDSSVIGLLAVEHQAGGRVERRVVSMIEQFAAHGALALRNSLLMQEVQTLADIDALTGVANRRIFNQALEREISRSARTDEPVSLLMIDIDHFKRYNDTHGHQAGDEVLKAVGSALKDASREFDIPARYGGEEFAVILPECSARQAAGVAERLREMVCAINVGEAITASAGVATFPTNASDASSLVRAADDALYESKRDGRDRLTKSRRHPRSKNPSNGVSA